MKRPRSWLPPLSALVFPLSWADAAASMKGAPEILFWGCLCVFGYLNHLAVPKPDQVKYSSRGFDVRFIPRTGKFPDDESEKRLVARQTPALVIRPAKPTAVKAAEEVPFYDQGAAATAAAKKPGLKAQEPGDDGDENAPAYSMAGFGVGAAAKGLSAGLAAFGTKPRGGEVQLAAASEAEAARAAPRLSEAQKKEAGRSLGILRSLWPATVRVLLDSKTFNDAFYANAFARQACDDPKFLASYLADAKNPEGVKRELGHVLALLQEPDSARAATKTEFAQRLVECPAVQKLGHDRLAVAALLKANPDLVRVAEDPLAAEILRSDPRSAGMYAEVTQALKDSGRPTRKP